jgi:PAS domain S-box-containing protein
MKKTQNKFYDLLKTDEAVFDFFQRYALDGIIFQDLSTPKNSWVNDKLYEVLGYVDEEQNVLNDILSSPQIKNNLPLIKKQNNLTTEVCFKHKNGKDIWMVATSLYYSENDTIVTALKDITRTKEHELILENCNQEAQIGFWEIDILETNKLYWSSVTKDIHEVEHHYVPNIESAIYFYKEGYNRNIIAELHSLAMDKGISYTQELEIVTAKGNEKWIRTTCIPKLVNGKCISLYGTFQDITTQKKLNQQLEEEKVKLKNVIEGARIGTWEWNVQSGETIYNHRWAEMLGYTLAEISPMNINIWNNLVHPEDLKKSETLLENCFNKKSDYYEGEFRMKHKNGSWIWVYDKGKVFSWTEDGKPLMMYGIHLDITEKINEIDRYIGFIKHAPSAIAMFDVDMRYMAVSEQWVKDYGLKDVSEVIGKTHYELFPEIGDDWKAIHQKCLTGEKASRDEDKFIRINGEVQWLKWAIKPWYTPNGQVGGLIMMTEDITQAINNKELLHISEETFRGNFEYASIGMAISDNTGKGIKVNKTLCDMLGYSAHELLNISFVEITHPDDLEKDLALLKKVSDGEIDSYQIEKRCIHKQGHIVYIILALSVVKDDNNNILYYITQMVDITRLKETEQKLADALLHNQTILDASTQISIIRTDEHGIITTFNIGAENLLGYSAEEVLNKHTPLLFHSKEELEKQSKKIQAETGKIVSGFDVFVHMIENNNTPVSEWTYINKNNEQIPVLLTLNSVKQNGKNLGYLGIGINITEIKKAEKDIENLLNVTQDQNLRLRNFAHIVSHNLRSHSGNISALIDILQIEQKVLEDNVVFSYLKAASNNLKETIDHLNTVAALNASGTQKSDKINIKPLIESAISNVTGLAYDAKVTIQNLVNEDIFISGDLAYLDSIFLNLLTNGIKYRSTERNSYVIVSAKQTDQYIAISFKDNGLGIDLQKNGSKLFGMYKTFHKNPDARGVGLFITKNQIESMGGKIEAESTPNVGTTFTVYFKSA